MLPAYDLDKIKFATDSPTFERAVALYETGKVTEFETDSYGCSAIVLGTRPYRVFVSARHYNKGSCECYLGQKDILCKHIVAVAICAVAGGRVLAEKDKQLVSGPLCSGKLGELNKEELGTAKKSAIIAMRYIKGYRGPSRTWFDYQNSLSEGCNRLSAIVSELPISRQTAKLLIDILLRIDKKLQQGGVDDSDGTVGGFIYEAVNMLGEYAKLDPSCIKEFKKLQNKFTCFDWEEPLLKLFK